MTTIRNANERDKFRALILLRIRKKLKNNSYLTITVKVKTRKKMNESYS